MDRVKKMEWGQKGEVLMESKSRCPERKRGVRCTGRSLRSEKAALEFKT